MNQFQNRSLGEHQSILTDSSFSVAKQNHPNCLDSCDPVDCLNLPDLDSKTEIPLHNGSFEFKLETIIYQYWEH